MKFNAMMAAVLSTAAVLSSCVKTTTVEWREGAVAEDGKATHTLVIYNPPKGTDWNVFYSQFRITPVIDTTVSTGTFVHLNGVSYRAFALAEQKDSVVIRYTAAPLKRRSWAPEGFVLRTADGKKTVLDVKYVFQPCEDVEPFPYNQVEVAAWDMIPRVKSATPLEGTTVAKMPAEGSWTAVEGKPQGWYRLTVDGGVAVEAADELGAYYAGVSLANMISNVGSTTIPSVVIADWPDLGYRGVMLDPARNFVSKEGVLKMLDIMARYKLSVLHMHLGDDEGWRLEVEGLPELTTYGGFHELPQINEDGSFSEPEALIPSHCGISDAKDASLICNGYYSIEDYKEILRYAKERHIRVIPEFDAPGHSRACIKAMEHRFETTGDAECRLVEPEDKSVYMSVQHFPDNTLNVALESTYTFMDKLFASVVKTYAEAGAELGDIHIGGDEVAKGCWLESPACKALLETLRADNPEGLSDTNLLAGYFLGRMMDIADKYGVALDGWQEITQHVDSRIKARLLDGRLGSVNIWSTIGSRETLPYIQANEGVPVVLSNVTNAYADLAYNNSKLEKGHSWGGYVDERRAFSLLPFDVYKSVRWDDDNVIKDISAASEGKVKLLRPECIKGVQIQLWGETIRSFDDVTYYIFPKMLGVFERGWNATPAWQQTTSSDAPEFMADFDRFYSIVVAHEMPWYDSQGICYRKR